MMAPMPAWLRAFEDESFVDSTKRVALWRHVRKFVWMIALFLLVLMRFVPLVWMALGLIASSALLGLSVLDPVHFIRNVGEDRGF
jgi:hypothetical protein